MFFFMCYLTVNGCGITEKNDVDLTVGLILQFCATRRVSAMLFQLTSGAECCSTPLTLKSASVHNSVLCKRIPLKVLLWAIRALKRL